jgi:hypothetical protein
VTPERRSERERRDEAQRNAEDLVEEAVREVPPSDMKQVLSLRMDPQLIRSLRRIATERGTTVSELLRQAATEIVSGSKVRHHVAFRQVGTGPLGLQSPPPVDSHSSVA